MSKPLTSPAPKITPPAAIVFPLEILAVRGAREAVANLQTAIADNQSHATEIEVALTAGLVATDLRAAASAKKLESLLSQAQLAERRGALLGEELIAQLTTLRALNIRAQNRLVRDAVIVVEILVQEDVAKKNGQEGDRTSIALAVAARLLRGVRPAGDVPVDEAGEDYIKSRSFHSFINHRARDIAAEQPPGFAPEIARQILDQSEEIYAKLPPAARDGR